MATLKQKVVDIRLNVKLCLYLPSSVYLRYLKRSPTPAMVALVDSVDGMSYEMFSLPVFTFGKRLYVPKPHLRDGEDKTESNVTCSKEPVPSFLGIVGCGFDDITFWFDCAVLAVYLY